MSASSTDQASSSSALPVRVPPPIPSSPSPSPSPYTSPLVSPSSHPASPSLSSAARSNVRAATCKFCRLYFDVDNNEGCVVSSNAKHDAIIHTSTNTPLLFLIAAARLGTQARAFASHAEQEAHGTLVQAAKCKWCQRYYDFHAERPEERTCVLQGKTLGEHVPIRRLEEDRIAFYEMSRAQLNMRIASAVSDAAAAGHKKHKAGLKLHTRESSMDAGVGVGVVPDLASPSSSSASFALNPESMALSPTVHAAPRRVHFADELHLAQNEDNRDQSITRTQPTIYQSVAASNNRNNNSINTNNNDYDNAMMDHKFRQFIDIAPKFTFAQMVLSPFLICISLVLMASSHVVLEKRPTLSVVCFVLFQLHNVKMMMDDVLTLAKPPSSATHSFVHVFRSLVLCGCCWLSLSFLHDFGFSEPASTVMYTVTPLFVLLLVIQIGYAVGATIRECCSSKTTISTSQSSTSTSLASTSSPQPSSSSSSSSPSSSFSEASESIGSYIAFICEFIILFTQFILGIIIKAHYPTLCWTSVIAVVAFCARWNDGARCAFVLSVLMTEMHLSSDANKAFFM